MSNKTHMFWKNKLEKSKLKLKESKVEELIDKMINQQLDIHYSPISEEYFILDRDNKISICISDYSVRICNHDYLYEINLSIGVCESIKSKIKKSIQSKVDIIKKELFKNELDLVGKISNIYNG